MDYDDHRWREVWVPADTRTCHPGLDTYEERAGFRRWAATPREWDGQRNVLNFKASMPMRTWVSREVGAWDVPFLPYALDVDICPGSGDPP